jgi:hypothetical protein
VAGQAREPVMEQARDLGNVFSLREHDIKPHLP